MIVVSDTTPIHYLILIEAIELLPEVFGEIVIPNAVLSELRAVSTPIKIKDYLSELPCWLTVRSTTLILDEQLDEIDPGEREAILLAEELVADGLLIDDLAGREVAIHRGLNVIGTLGFLRMAADTGRIDFLKALEQLKNSGFYISSTLEKQLIHAYNRN